MYQPIPVIATQSETLPQKRSMLQEFQLIQHRECKRIIQSKGTVAKPKKQKKIKTNHDAAFRLKGAQYATDLGAASAQRKLLDETGTLVPLTTLKDWRKELSRKAEPDQPISELVANKGGCPLLLGKLDDSVQQHVRAI
jgi:hypothetical protein